MQLIDDLERQSYSFISVDLRWVEKIRKLYEAAREWFESTPEEEKEEKSRIFKSRTHPGKIGFSRVHEGKELFRFRRHPGAVFGLAFENQIVEVADFLHFLSIDMLQTILEYYGHDSSSYINEHIKDDESTQLSASPFDFFYYHNTKSTEKLPNCSPHVDPGFLTLIPVSPVSGLCIQKNGEWLNVELNNTPFVSIVVLANKMLETVSNGKIKAAVHAVDKNTQPRFSLVYELREKVET